MKKPPPYSVIQRAHQAVGGFSLIAFILSGLYLRQKAPAVYLGDEVSHMMFRANHIYILMAALANLSIGRYAVFLESKYNRMVQSLGMASMMAASGILIYAFTVEPALGSMERPRTLIGVVLLTLGVLFHLVSGMFGGEDRQTQERTARKTSRPQGSGTH